MNNLSYTEIFKYILLFGNINNNDSSTLHLFIYVRLIFKLVVVVMDFYRLTEHESTYHIQSRYPVRCSRPVYDDFKIICCQLIHIMRPKCTSPHHPTNSRPDHNTAPILTQAHSPSPQSPSSNSPQKLHTKS